MKIRIVEPVPIEHKLEITLSTEELLLLSKLFRADVRVPDLLKHDHDISAEGRATLSHMMSDLYYTVMREVRRVQF